MIVAARWIDPPTTAVHVQRHLQAWIRRAAYHERYQFIPHTQISPDLQHAVIAAEDARFYEHHGFDWHQMQLAAEGDLDGERTRGASTITQQLVKNLFFGTGRSLCGRAWRPRWCRWPNSRSASGAFWRLSKRGGMGASDLWRGGGEPRLPTTTARNIGREQAARLAAILPAPLTRRPQRMNSYSAIILRRMAQMGW